ncbi:MAG: SAM-dependent methyltransferase [Verrucomicrobiota bacterium]|jgi:SAM-dependent MidA family methyltransferase
MKMPNEIICEEIAKNGVLTFARFMELALYCPETGYYETERGKVGRGGDFITSVSTGNLFGQLLAYRFGGWLSDQNRPSDYVIVEAGAHDGRLAHDVLTWLQSHRPDVFADLKYCLLEPSPNRQRWQQETLEAFASHVRWASDFSQLATGDSIESLPGRINGIIFGNELLDAFPVHRFGWDKRRQRWFEWGVANQNGNLIWTQIDSPGLKARYPELEPFLPDGYTIDTSPAAEKWWSQAAGALEQGKLLTLDYGFTDGELFSPSRVNGTLRAYYRHHVTDDILANPGEQDLTAHINFSTFQKVGEAAGLTTESFTTQAKFLTQILEQTQHCGTFGEWNSSRARQFQTLTHPEHFGRAFRVLVQKR